MMRVAVVGAGIMGACSAYRLAQLGIEVHLFDCAHGPAEGVTRNAFGWVNTINGDPALGEAYTLRVRAVEEYESVLSEMPELMPHLRRGSLVWRDAPESTALIAAQHRRYGALDLAARSSIAAMEPRLKKLPELAIYSAQDIAVSPAALAGSFVARAESWGAVLHYGVRVLRLDATGQSVTGVYTESGLLRFDLVVLATGTHTGRLLEDIGMPLDMESSPGVLLRYQTNEWFIHNTLSFPRLEVRQAEDRSILVVEDFQSGCEEMNFNTLRQRVRDVFHECFILPNDLEFTRGAVSYRPTFLDGLPRRGFAQNVERLYVMAGHPGIILAPLLGRLAAEEIGSRYL